MSRKLTDRTSKTGRPRRAAGRFGPLDGRRVVVLLRQGDRQFVFRGRARLERDDEMGHVLRVVAGSDVPGAPELVMPEKGWQGRIIPDFEHGCDFCMIAGGSD